MNKNELHYYAVIPSKILIDKNITPNAKLLYGIISSLTNISGRCFASDNYFADIFGVSKGSLQRWLKELEDAGYISRNVFYKEGSKEIDHRDIILNGLMVSQTNKDTPIQESLNTGIHEIKTTGIHEIMIDNNIKENNKDKLAKANASSQVSSNIDIDKDNNLLDVKQDNLDKSRNVKKDLIPFIEESFNDSDVKDILIEWLLDVFANGKTLTLKQLRNQCDLLVANSSSKEELIDMVKKTLESKWATFRYVIEKKHNTKVLNKSNNNNTNNNIRITEQKRTSTLGNEVF